MLSRFCGRCSRSPYVFEDLKDFGGSWWAAWNADIDGNVAVHGASDRVAPFKGTAIDRAVAKGNHELRMRCLFIDVLQRVLHIGRDRSSHDERIRMARRGGDVKAEPLEVV